MKNLVIANVLLPLTLLISGLAFAQDERSPNMTPMAAACSSGSQCKPSEHCINGFCRPKASRPCNFDADCGAFEKCRFGKCE